MTFTERLFFYFLIVPIFLYALINNYAFSFEDDGTYVSGRYYETNGSPSTRAATASESCSLYNSAYHIVDVGHPNPFYTYRCYDSSETYYKSTHYYECSSSTALYCTATPSPDCPTEGTLTSVAYVVNGVFVDGVFIQTPTDGVIEIGGSVYDSETSCGYAFGTGENYQPAKCEVFDEGSAICFQDLYATGDTGTPVDNQYQVVTADTSPNSEGDGSTDTRVNTKTVNVADPISSTDSDGTNVTTNQTTTVETRGDGTQVSTQEETTFISESDGIIHEQIETTTTYEFPDGTTQVDTEIRDSYTQTPITNYTVNTTDGRVTIDASGGSSSSTVTNITNNYAADGTLTGSSETSSTEGDSEIAEEEEQKSECQENPMSKECTGEFTKTEKGGFKSDAEQGSALWHYNQATAELQTLYDTIQAEITAELGLTLAGGGTAIESDPLYWHGQEFSSGGGIANLISWFDFMNISTLVLLVFGLVSFFILVRD